MSSGQLNIPPQELECLALNVYHESRSESELGKIAVTHVVFNRMKSEKYPDTACKVIKKAKYEAGKPKKNACHFSWYCDGKADTPLDKAAWDESISVVYRAYVIYQLGTDVTSGSIMYHAKYVKPYWRSAYKRITTIDTHIFYGEKKK